MSQHPSLKSSKTVGAKRNVLKRFERIKQLRAEGRFAEGRSPLGLPKTKPAD
jgi:small basic protein (TIGR04137 family)